MKGAREIGFAIVAMTLTLAAVYAPIAFTPGRTGRLFLEFAVTLAGAVVVSGFVALTLTPMMCSKLLKHNDRPNVFMRAVERVLEWLERAYRPSCAWRWLAALARAAARRWRCRSRRPGCSPRSSRSSRPPKTAAP
jgi:multidrug efflux pump